MKKSVRSLSSNAALLAAILAIAPVFAADVSGKDSVQSTKAVQKEKRDHGHDHDHDHGGNWGHAGHGEVKSGTGKTDVRQISAALRENLACLEKEISTANHEVFHACLKTMEDLGLDLMALKTPSDPTRKKRVNGYAKNLGMMAHKVDEYMDGKQPEKAKDQLKKLNAQVVLIESQFEELKKKENPGK